VPGTRTPILFVFLDGVGIGRADPLRNPLAVAEMPTLRSLLGGGRLVAEELGPDGVVGEAIAVGPIDANLGVAGRPQSGTGQTALLTGLNAAELLGRHFGPWVPTALRELLETRSLFREAARRGHRVTFANAYPAGYLEPGGRGVRRPGALPLAARAAGVLVRDEVSLRRGEALASSITTEAWRRYVDPLAPLVEPEEAGHRLAHLARAADLTVFAHYDTDYIGHRGDFTAAIEVLERCDRFLGGVLAALPGDALLLVSSDHGNIEDVGAGHTRNPVPLLAVGARAEGALRGVRSIMDLTPFILGMLDLDS
jgi:2,3-bisphosphoglycerate-independent phosphoglycerate mutase